MNCIIIIPTNSAYLDICENFLNLLRINWKNCKYKIIFSVCGEDKRITDCETIYNGENATLPKCILNAKRLYPADYYFVFLGDAFISKLVNNEDVEKCLLEMHEYNINYCRLLPQNILGKERIIEKRLRYINTNERYGHSFIAFIATKQFIEKEFGKGISDRDFEIKYLELANKNRNVSYFKDRAICRKNIFHIMPGIEKGKWDRIVLKKLKYRYPEINFAKRDLISIKKEVFLLIRRKIKHIIPSNMRRSIKRKIKTKDLFDTEN